MRARPFPLALLVLAGCLPQSHRVGEDHTWPVETWNLARLQHPSGSLLVLDLSLRRIDYAPWTAGFTPSELGDLPTLGSRARTQAWGDVRATVPGFHYSWPEGFPAGTTLWSDQPDTARRHAREARVESCWSDDGADLAFRVRFPEKGPDDWWLFRFRPTVQHASAFASAQVPCAEALARAPTATFLDLWEPD